MLLKSNKDKSPKLRLNGLVLGRLHQADLILWSWRRAGIGIGIGIRIGKDIWQ